MDGRPVTLLVLSYRGSDQHVFKHCCYNATLGLHTGASDVPGFVLLISDIHPAIISIYNGEKTENLVKTH